LNSDFPFIKRGQGETPQSEQPAKQSQKSQAKTYPWPQIHHRIQGQRLIFHFNPQNFIREQRSVQILLIWYSSSGNSWIWFKTQVLLAFFNTSDRLLLLLHFHSHHQCHVVRQCFIYELVTSTKLAFLSLQNSKCKYSPMPLEF